MKFLYFGAWFVKKYLSLPLSEDDTSKKVINYLDKVGF